MTRDSQRIKKLSRVRFLFSLADARKQFFNVPKAVPGALAPAIGRQEREESFP